MEIFRSNHYSAKAVPAPFPEEAAAIAVAITMLLENVHLVRDVRVPVERWRLAARMEAHGVTDTDRGLARGWRW